MFSFLSPTHQFTFDMALITTLLVISIHLTFRAGLFALSPLGFAAIGGYTTAILVTDHSWPVLGSIVVAPVAAAVVAAAFALPVLRLRGIYFALGTIALAQLIVVLISNVEFTNGVFGIARIPNVVETWHLLVLVGAIVLYLQLESRSHFGRALSALRLAERTADGLGINVRRLRFNTFVASAALAGLAGALEAHRTTVVSPGQYSFAALLPILIYALVGGNSHWFGPVMTAWTLIFLRTQLHFMSSATEDLIYGVILIVVTIFAPSGLSDPALTMKARRLVIRRFSGAKMPRGRVSVRERDALSAPGRLS